MLFPVFFLVLGIAGNSAGSPGPMIHKIDIVGNFRVPAATVLHTISSSPGFPFDEIKTQGDIRRLFETNLFRWIEVSSSTAGDGSINLTYRVKENPAVTAVDIEGVSRALEEQIRTVLRKEKMEMRSATMFQPVQAHKAAKAIRDYLRQCKYAMAEVHVETVEKAGNVVVRFKAEPGPSLDVGEVLFMGNNALSQKELVKQMPVTRPDPLWARFTGAGRYTPDQLNSDLRRVREYYGSRGYAAAVIMKPDIAVRDFRSRFWIPVPGKARESEKLAIRIPVAEGAIYDVISASVEGDPGAADHEIAALLGSLQTPSRYDYALLEKIRQKMIQSLGHLGYALAQVHLLESRDDQARTIKAVYKIERGNVALVGKIRFEGNARLSDKFLRRELKIGEQDIFDSRKLDASIENLNRSNLIKELRREDVALEMVTKSNCLDMIFKVKEKDRQGIYGTGGTGGIGGGYLGFFYTFFNLLRIGETLSLELDGGAAQSNILLNMVGSHFLGPPFMIALSGFHRFTNFNVANIVPGPQNLVQVFRKRSNGIGLSGTYSFARNLSGGAAFQVSRDTIEQASTPDAPCTTTRENRSEVAPFLVFDSTHGTGPGMRGTRVALSHAFAGGILLKSLDTMRDSFQFARSIDDPFGTRGNSLGFRFLAGSARARGNQPLRLEQRFFPGNEIVRGFRRGALSSWAEVPEAATLLQAAGADTVLGISVEYRVPIHRSVNGAAFFDLGWTKLNPRNAATLGSGARLIERTNGLLRASTGFELRTQLPMIRQTGRLIFAWNPLWLHSLLTDNSSYRQLLDPRGSIHFALGNQF